ncbi:MAG: superoxide dismutase family protein [Isosphaeraceae bacterium]
MSITRAGTTLAVGSLVCLGLLTLRTAAVAQHEAGKTKAAAITKAVAILMPTKNSEAKGRVTFTEKDGKVHVRAEISGLKPGKHGFHIHEFGVWSEDGMAAGGHFNPTGSKHGAPHESARHVGDLGNLEANENGNATIDDVAFEGLRFHGPASILGRGLVVHEKADDFGQPVGNAGGRVAVGVIGIAKP